LSYLATLSSDPASNDNLVFMGAGFVEGSVVWLSRLLVLLFLEIATSFFGTGDIRRVSELGAELEEPDIQIIVS